MRTWRLFLIPIIAIALAAALLFSVRSGGHSPAMAAVPVTSPSAPAAGRAQPSAAAHLPAASVPTAPPLVTSVPTVSPTETHLVLVEGEPILPADVAAAAAIDAAMSTLVGTAATAREQLLPQLINHRLVLRAARAAGVAPSNPGVRIEALLAEHGKTKPDLDALLKVHAVAWPAFEQYLGELVLVDEFARAEAARQGITVETYVAGLQKTADIRYGSAPTAAVTDRSAAPARLAAATPAPTGDPAAAPAPVHAGAPPEEARGVLVGQLAPQFALATLGAGDTTTSADLLGRPTVLSFWTTWCPYCLRQTPVMVAAATRYATSDVQFVGIDVAEGADVVASYVAQHGIPYPILLDETGDVAAAYAVTGYPTTYFLDADGRIVAHQIGAMTEQQLTATIEELLATD